MNKTAMFVSLCFLLCACANQGGGNFVMNEKTIDDFFHTGKLIQNEDDDLAGTYKGEGGTAVIKKTDDAVMLEDKSSHGMILAELPHRAKQLPDGVINTGKKAENAYIITAELKECPKADINEDVLVVHNDSIHTANQRLPYSVSKNGDELTFDFSMATNGQMNDSCESITLTKVK